MAAKKIVIPKGTINPQQTSVIEIPNELQGSSVVVARSIGGSSPGSSPVSGSPDSSMISGNSTGGSYKGASSSYGDSSGWSYKGASQFANSSQGLSPPPNISGRYGHSASVGGDISPMSGYNEFRYNINRGGGHISSPYTDWDESEMEDSVFEDSEFEESVSEQMGLLSNLDFVEYDQLMDDLNTFQRYRRRLEQDLSNMGCTQF